MDPRYLTYGQAADYLGTTISALYKRVERGEVPVIKVGRWVRFDRYDLDAWLHTYRIEASA